MLSVAITTCSDAITEASAAEAWSQARGARHQSGEMTTRGARHGSVRVDDDEGSKAWVSREDDDEGKGKGPREE